MTKKKVSSAKTKKAGKTKSFPIIAIGASAGGLEALETLFTNMPSDNNIAFIVIQHLDPKRKSIMSSLLKKHTTMKIYEVKDGTKIEPNCIYLNPPNKNMTIMNNTLQLNDPIQPHGFNLPIDSFFRSLSEDQSDRAICIILSGTGSDGTLGLKAIKGAGGMVMVQEEKQAKYNGMPRSAIDTGLVDYVLPVEKMGAELAKFVNHPYIGTSKKVTVKKGEFDNYLQKIFVLIRSQTGHDFSHYKQNTIRRRIERRLAVHQIEKIADYVSYLRQTPKEIDILFKDLLITVTTFFRDPDAFEILRKKGITKLLEKMESDSSFRVWVPGCATGEEAYSIAMLLVESMEKMKKNLNIQIFATDIDEEAIDQARLSVYPDSISVDVSADRLKRFFLKEGDCYRIKKIIRDLVIFSTQNLIKDPPFSKLHLVSCRNVLIYMDQVLQKKILPLFHYTLQPDGILFLGSSESIGEFTQLYSTVDTKWKIFRQQNPVSERPIEYPRSFFNGPHATDDKIAVTEPQGLTNVRSIAEKLILEKYSFPCVLINENYDILFFNGDTSQYLTPPVGEPSFNLLLMVREDLRYILNTALYRAIKQQTLIAQENVRLKHNDSYLTLDLLIQPVAEQAGSQGLFMVVFNEKKQQKTVKKKTTEPEKKQIDQRVAVLEQELQSTKEYLQTTIEELETTNEELNSSYEELQSTNEELQSTNEELETSKEELQSTNEELMTVNAELQNKVDELSHANNDINNLLASTDIATIFLDNDLRIKRFTPSMTIIFNLIQSDIDRPIGDITSNIRYDNLAEDAVTVLRTLIRKEVVVQNNAGYYFSMRIAPYRSTENKIEGVVITFVDVTKIRQAEQKAQRLAAVVKDSNDAVTVQNLDGAITAWNNGAEKMYGYAENEALKMNIYDIVPENKKKETAEIFNLIKSGKTVRSHETERLTKDGRVLEVWVTGTVLRDDTGKITALATTERDMTEAGLLKADYERRIEQFKKQFQQQQST